ncbi:MAG: hypothetical protein OJF49_002729 [Ktedonobacterales bacterium]|jgi:uncharacterized membrane protein YphA (DoxX/SURF4 family)|nr:MAG: hypothetical protein OJF49_002729 [Ktedonobacterales bacterium]
MNIVLWIAQILLALAFLMAGIPKATQPIPILAKRLTWAADIPMPLVRFIGVAEILGAIGLILPALTQIQPWLTIAAALGLALIMLGAIIFHIARKEYAQPAMNAILLLLALLIVIGRWKLAPIG